MTRVHGLFSRFTLLAAFCLAAVAAQAADFQVLEPRQPTESPGKIEVVEFFSYGCPHCKEFNPQLDAWAAKQPGDVRLRRIPVSFGRPAWGNLARLYYTLEAGGYLGQFDEAVFKAEHEERAGLENEGRLKEWIARKGLDPKRFNDLFNSFTVLSKTRSADLAAEQYGINAVPALAVDGRFLVSADLPHDRQLAVAEQLIARVRAEKAGKK
jgi:protein dithiol oxidoreductase (disulfide-forming)